MSDFWKRKMRTYFKRIDFDGDGIITQKDFVGMADRFIKMGDLKEGDAKNLMAKVIQVQSGKLSLPEKRTQGVFCCIIL